MARYCGKLGFSFAVEKSPGIWEDTIIERKYYGDVTKDYKKYQDQNRIVEGISIRNVFSIVADPFAFENLGYLKYIKYLGIAWKIESVDVQRPRLIISVGDRWNGPEYIEQVEEEPINVNK